MPNYNNIKATIAANVYPNGQGEVTAPMVRTAMYTIVDALEQVDNNLSGKFYGFAPTSADLPAGDEVGYAYVGSSAPFAVWNFDGTSWSDSGVTHTPAEGNGEDIDTNTQGKLQFADRPNTDGMGYIILRKNKTFAEQVTAVNTIYEIRYDFDLGGASVTIPAGCALKFNGGRIYNGTLVGTDTRVDAGNFDHIFDSNLVISGVWDGGCFVDWFGATCLNDKPDSYADVSANIQAALDSAFGVINFNAGWYCIDNPITIRNTKGIHGIFHRGYNFDSSTKNSTVIYTASNITCIIFDKSQPDNNVADRRAARALDISIGSIVIDNILYSTTAFLFKVPYSAISYGRIRCNIFNSALMAAQQGTNVFPIPAVGSIGFNFTRNTNANGGLFCNEIESFIYGFEIAFTDYGCLNNSMTATILKGKIEFCSKGIEIYQSAFNFGKIQVVFQARTKYFASYSDSIAHPWISGKIERCVIDSVFWDTTDPWTDASFTCQNGVYSDPNNAYNGAHTINIDFSKSEGEIVLAGDSYGGPTNGYPGIAKMAQFVNPANRMNYLLDVGIQESYNKTPLQSYIKGLDNKLLDLYAKNMVYDVVVEANDFTYTGNFNGIFDEGGTEITGIASSDPANASLKLTFRLKEEIRIDELILHRGSEPFSYFKSAKMTMISSNGSEIIRQDNPAFFNSQSDILLSLETPVYANRKSCNRIVLEFSSLVLKSGSANKFRLFLEGGNLLMNRPGIQLNRVYTSLPSLSSRLFTGMMAFNKTTGKPVWWNGSGWVDATGASV